MASYTALPESHGGAPAIEPSVLRRLATISRGLKPVWRNYVFDYQTAGTLIGERGAVAGKPVPWPGGGGRWIMFHEAELGRVEFLFVIQTRDGHYHPLDHRVPDMLAADIARRAKPSEIADLMEQMDERSRKKLREHYDQLQMDKFRENPRKIREALQNIGSREAPSQNVRSVNPMSYRGQGLRRSSAEQTAIPLTAEEEGWYLPDMRKELHGTGEDRPR